MFKKILRHKTVAALSGAGLTFVIGGGAWAYAVLRTAGSGSFILHFNDIRGVTELGGAGMILAVAAFGVLAVIADLWIAVELADRDERLATGAATMALVFGILLFIGFAAILNVN